LEVISVTTRRPDGNGIIVRDFDSGREVSVTYEISNGSLIMIEKNGSRATFKKCGVNVGW